MKIEKLYATYSKTFFRKTKWEYLKWKIPDIRKISFLLRRRRECPFTYQSHNSDWNIVYVLHLDIYYSAQRMPTLDAACNLRHYDHETIYVYFFPIQPNYTIT